MATRSDDRVQKVTSELSAEMLSELFPSEEDIVYQAVPNPTGPGQSVWRVRFDPTFTSRYRMGLDINGETVLGRASDEPGCVTVISPEDAEQLGVSRHHALLRPTDSKLYIIDLNSTNGTFINGRSIGVNTPYSLSNGDRLVLGRLECTVTIVKRPAGQTAMLHQKADFADLLPAVARAITAQLDLKDVLKQTMDTVMAYTPADEVTVWLVDDQTGELFLEAGRGVNNEQIARLPLTDTLAGKVLASGQPIFVNRSPDQGQLKLKTGYLVEAVIYVPLALGGVTFGVLSAAHHTPGKTFNPRDEKLMTAVADLTAIAIQNARTYQATEKALSRRVKIVTAMNCALSSDLKSLLNATLGYASMLNDYAKPGCDIADLSEQITQAGSRMAAVVDQLTEIARLCDTPTLHRAALDLVDVVSKGVYDLQAAAEAKIIQLTFQVMGEPYIVQGDAVHLYRSILHLVDNAIRFSPVGATVSVALVFGFSDVIIRVRDTGPGIHPDDLPYLFDKYFRSPATNGQTGLGLGLEFVRATVEAHRGTVSVRNAEDQGAEFIITLPGSLRVS